MEKYVVSVTDSAGLKDTALRDSFNALVKSSTSGSRAPGIKNAQKGILWQRLTDGAAHRTDGPAVLVFGADGGAVVEEWFESGLLHRIDGPAFKVREEERITESWHHHGIIDRQDGPAEVVRDEQTGRLVSERWMRSGKLHRDGGPAFSYHAASGVMTTEKWAEHGEYHRLNAPAEIERDSDTGAIVDEAWYRHGQLHREDGAAWIQRDGKTGEIRSTEHYLDGEQVTPSAVRAYRSGTSPTP